MKGRNRCLLLVSVVTVALSVGSIASAGLLKGLTGSTSTNSTGDNSTVTGALLDSLAKLSVAYVASSADFATSLEKAADAVGVKKEVVEKLAVIKALQDPNIKLKSDDVKKISKMSEEGIKIVEDKMNEVKEPSANSKKLMTESMMAMGSAITKKALLAKNAADLSTKAKSVASGISVTDVKSVAAAKNVVTMSAALGTAIPTDVKLMKGALSTQVAYAKTHNIKIPADASKLLKD
jgi:hypothetical protein